MKRERIVWLDVVRSFAIVMVVMCHAVEQVYDMSLIGWQNLNYISKLFRSISFTFGRLGVPLFLLLTGYLVLGKQIENDESCIKFYKRSLLPMLICTEIWIIIYNVFNSFIAGGVLNIKVLLLNMCFLEGTHMTNMWYMPMILGVYLVAPFLAVILRQFTYRILIWPLVISLIANFIIPSIGIVCNAYNLPSYNTVLNLMFLGGWYGAYVFIGHFFTTTKKEFNTGILLLLFLISFFATSFFQFAILTSGYEYNLWYNFVGLIITSIFLFALLKGFEKSKLYELCGPVASHISKISLGIFFLHKPVLICINPLFSNFSLSQPIETLVLFAVAFGLCMVIVSLLSKMKLIGKMCFLIKS